MQKSRCHCPRIGDLDSLALEPRMKHSVPVREGFVPDKNSRYATSLASTSIDDANIFSETGYFLLPHILPQIRPSHRFLRLFSFSCCSSPPFSALLLIPLWFGRFRMRAQSLLAPILKRYFRLMTSHAVPAGCLPWGLVTLIAG